MRIDGKIFKSKSGGQNTNWIWNYPIFPLSYSSFISFQTEAVTLTVAQSFKLAFDCWSKAEKKKIMVMKKEVEEEQWEDEGIFACELAEHDDSSPPPLCESFIYKMIHSFIYMLTVILTLEGMDGGEKRPRQRAMSLNDPWIPPRPTSPNSVIKNLVSF